MAGTIIENLSNRKLAVVLGIILTIQIVAFLIGAVFAPAPSTSEQYIAIKCLPDDPNDWSIPRDGDVVGQTKRTNCGDAENLHSDVTFAVQMPLPRNNVILDYSRWMSSLLVLLVPEVLYDTRLPTAPAGQDQAINTSVIMKVSLGVRNIGDAKWTTYYHNDALERHLWCRINAEHRKQGMNYDCDILQLFDLQSLHYDFYLLNLRFVSKNDNFGFLSNLQLVAIHQNGGFTQIWLALKTVFFTITLATLLWFVNRLRKTLRDPNLLEKSLILLGFGLTQLNVPIEYATLYFDLPFMSFLSDIRQGAFHCTLLTFWVVFVGEHLLDDVCRSGIAAYYKQVGIILTGYLALFAFSSAERGLQVFDPFYSIWTSHADSAIFLIAVSIFCATVYLIFLSYNLWTALRNISTKQLALSGMPSARRLLYQGVIFRFKFLLGLTFVCAISTVVVYMMGQVSGDGSGHWSAGDGSGLWTDDLQWTSAMFTTVYALWNCYVITLLVLYAPSHKGLNSPDDLAVEFTRLTDGMQETATASIRHTRPQSRSLLSEIATKQSLN